MHVLLKATMTHLEAELKKKATSPYCRLQFGMKYDWHSDEETEGSSTSEVREGFCLSHIHFSLPFILPAQANLSLSVALCC